MVAARKYGLAAVIAIAGAVVIWLAVRGGDSKRPPGGSDEAPASDDPTATARGDLPRIVASPARHASGQIRPGIVSGTVREWITGEPVGSVDVLISGAGVEYTATSGDDGRFSLELSPGAYALRAVGDDAVGFGISWLAVSPDARSKDIDVLVAILARIEGRVVDQDGAPVEGAHITHETTQWERTLTTDDTAPEGEARSNAAGAFAIRVPPGTVQLTASAAGRPAAVAIVRDVRPDASVVGVELVFQAGAVLDGKVHDSEGRPVVGALVVATEPYGARRETTSDGDGRFELAALPRGRLTIEASAPGFAASLPAQVTIGTVKPPRTVLVLRAAQAISGIVAAADGTPIGDARVTATAANSQLPPIEATTRADGVFRIEPVGRGPYDIAAQAIGFAPGRRVGVAGDATDIRLELQASGGITGTITSGGEPLADFTVRIASFVPRGGAPVFGDGKLIRFASIDGVYQIADLEPGAYELTISSPGRAPADLRGIVVPAGGYGTASAELGPGGVITGRVTDAETRAPIDGAIVTLSTGHEGEIRYTNADGVYRIDSVAPGRRSIEFRHPRYDIRMETGGEIAAGDTQTIDVALSPLRADGEQRFEFAGIGAALKLESGGLAVLGVGDGGPAQRAGILVGDIITAVDGKPVAERTFADNIEAIRGVVGTVVTLAMRRASNDFELEVMRDNVRSRADELGPDAH